MDITRVYNRQTEYEVEAGVPARIVGTFDNDSIIDWWRPTNRDDPTRLKLTKSRQWVLESKPDCYYLTPAEARAWLIRNGHRDAVTAHLGHDEAGRPPVGPEVKLRLPQAVITAVEQLGQENNWDRATTLRVLVIDQVSALGRLDDWSGAPHEADAVNVDDLARELDVTAADIKVYVDQLVSQDGRAAVIAKQEMAKHARKPHNDAITWLTDEAAKSIRIAVAAQREA